MTAPVTVYCWNELGIFDKAVEITDVYGPIPPRSTTTPIPTDLPAGKVPLWLGSSWTVIDAPVYPVNFNGLRDELQAKVAEMRWKKETAGIKIAGVNIATGTADQNRITTVIANAQLAGVTTVDFKSVGGWVRLSIGEIQGIAAAIALHVQACFSAERTHSINVAALPDDESAIKAYDYTTGWPATADDE